MATSDYDRKAEAHEALWKTIDPEGDKKRQQAIHAMLRDTGNHCVMCGFFLGVHVRTSYFLPLGNRTCPTCGYEGNEPT